MTVLFLFEQLIAHLTTALNQNMELQVGEALVAKQYFVASHNK